MGDMVINMGAAAIVKKIEWKSRLSEQNRSPKDFTIQGSNDFSDWDVLATFTGETGWTSGATRGFTVQ